MALSLTCQRPKHAIMMIDRNGRYACTAHALIEGRKGQAVTPVPRVSGDRMAALALDTFKAIYDAMISAWCGI